MDNGPYLFAVQVINQFLTLFRADYELVPDMGSPFPSIGAEEVIRGKNAVEAKVLRWQFLRAGITALLIFVRNGLACLFLIERYLEPPSRTSTPWGTRSR